MKQSRILITLLFILATTGINGQSLMANDIFKIKIFGKVQSIEEIEYSSFGLTKEDIVGCPKNLSYNNQGKLIHAIYCVGDLYFDYVIEYDKKGNQAIERTSFEHNENVFDNNGNLIEHKIAVTQNGHFGKWIYKYDKKNNQIEQTGYIEDNISERWIYKYDKKENRIEEVMVGDNNDSTVYKRKVFEYDKRRNIIHQIYIVLDDVPRQWEFLYKYDKLNILIESIQIDDQKKIEKTTYNYKFDKKNNWIEKVCLVDGSPSQYFRRNIKYR